MKKDRQRRNVRKSTPKPTGSKSHQKWFGPRWQAVIILLLPFLLYFNTLNHDYVLDDEIVIRGNAFTQQGLSGVDNIFANESFVGYYGKQKKLVAGSRYRPLSIASFALEKELFGENKTISHFLNVLFYAFTGLLIWLLLRQLTNVEVWSKWQMALPFFTAILFVAHPIHTEAVANIKGRDEIFALLFSVWALWLAFRAYDSKKMRLLIWAGITYAAALFSKENAITMVAVLPLLLWIFRKPDWPKAGRIIATFAGAAAFFLLIRYLVIGSMTSEASPELMNDPFLLASTGEQFATTIYTWGRYLLLLLFPHPLTNDYYPFHIAYHQWSDWEVIVSFLAVMALAVYGIWAAWHKKIPGIAILFFLITFSIVSNLVFPVGVFMAERLLFMPSLGFSLLVAWVLLSIPIWLDNQNALEGTSAPKFLRSMRVANPIGLIVILILLAGYSWKTVDRNRAWQDNQTLFLTDIEISTNSAKANNAAGGTHYDLAKAAVNKEDKEEHYALAQKYLEKAVDIHPTYNAPWITLGNVYALYTKEYKKAMDAYKHGGAAGYGNMMQIAEGLINEKKPDDAEMMLMALLEAPKNEFNQKAKVYEMMGRIYGQYKKDLKQSIYFLQKSVEADASYAKGWENLGVAYAMQGDHQNAATALEKAVSLNPDNLQTWQNLVMAYASSGQLEKAAQAQQKVKQLQSR